MTLLIQYNKNISELFEEVNSKDYRIFIVLFLIGNLSLINNSLNIASPSWYQIYGYDSEQLVLDGILNSDKEKAIKSSYLGEYTRPNLKKNAQLSRQYFRENNKEGKFNRYTSQFGLQVKIFSFLNSLGIPINWLRTFNSFLLCIILSSSYLILRRSNFNKLGSISFTLALLLSPWIIVSSPNLYWVTFTWYIPAFISSIFISSSLIFKRIYIYLFFLLVFFAFLLKFLCGFEYITSILLFTIISTLLIGFKRGIEKKLLIKNIFIVTFACILAFIISISLTISDLNKAGYDGYELVKFTALKRSSISYNDKIFDNYCNSNNNKNSFEDCKESLESISKSLKSNRILIVSKYFFVKEFLPWFHSDFSELSYEDKSIIKKNINTNLLEFHYIKALKILNKFTKIFLFRLINLLSFPSLIIFTVWINKERINTILILGLSSAAPLSWFLIANGHSAVHTHINYTLMYMGFIPITFYLFSTNLFKKLFK